MVSLGIVSNSYCVEDQVMAIVNNEVITEAEFNMYINLLKLQLGQKGWEENGLSEKKALEGLIEDRLIVQEAKNKKIEIEDRMVESRIERIKKGVGSEEGFSQALSKQGLSLSELEERIREQMLSEKLIDQEVRSRILVSPKEVTQYYKDNIKEFYLPEHLEVDSIFVKDQNQAQEIYNKLKEGVDFLDLQKQYSERANLGLVNRGQLRKEIEEAIFSLGIGSFSKPLSVEDGYYIFLVREKIDASQKELIEVQYYISNMLSEKKFSMKMNEWLVNLKNNSYIVIKDK